jgi:hypothetical protein
MKRLLVSLLVIAGMSGVARAATDYDSQTVTYKLSVAANVSTAAVVVDLSDNTNWLHKFTTSEIQVNSVRLEVDKVAASTTSIRIGVVTYVSASTGCVTWFLHVPAAVEVSNAKVDSTVIDSGWNLRVKKDATDPTVTNGSTPYILSNDTTFASTTYQTDVKLASPVGSAGTAPGLGDLVMDVTNGTGAVVVYLSVNYNVYR